MKWLNGLTSSEKYRIIEENREKLKDWHNIFLWFPTIVGEKNGRHIKMWLEIVERKGTYYPAQLLNDGSVFHSYWTWEYREIGENK